MSSPALQLAVAEAFTLFPRPCSGHEVAAILNARDTSVAEATEALRELALIWGEEPELHPVGTLAEAIGESVSGLGPSLATLLRPRGPAHVRSLLDELGLTPSGDVETDLAVLTERLSQPSFVAGVAATATEKTRALLEAVARAGGRWDGSRGAGPSLAAAAGSGGQRGPRAHRPAPRGGHGSARRAHHAEPGRRAARDRHRGPRATGRRPGRSGGLRRVRPPPRAAARALGERPAEGAPGRRARRARRQGRCRAAPRGRGGGSAHRRVRPRHRAGRRRIRRRRPRVDADRDLRRVARPVGLRALGPRRQRMAAQRPCLRAHREGAGRPPPERAGGRRRAPLDRHDPSAGARVPGRPARGHRAGFGDRRPVTGAAGPLAAPASTLPALRGGRLDRGGGLLAGSGRSRAP